MFLSGNYEYFGESMEKKYNREEGKGRIMEGVLYLMTETGLHSIGDEGRCFKYDSHVILVVF